MVLGLKLIKFSVRKANSEYHLKKEHFDLTFTAIIEPSTRLHLGRNFREYIRGCIMHLPEIIIIFSVFILHGISYLPL